MQEIFKQSYLLLFSVASDRQGELNPDQDLKVCCVSFSHGV